MRSTPRRIPWSLAAAIVVGMAAIPAAGQVNDSDLKKENEALQAQTRQLQADLDAARRQIEELQHQIALLRETIQSLRDARQPPTETQPEQVSIDESVPQASPRALLRALTESYDEAVADERIGHPGDAQRRAYLLTVRQWAASAERRLKGPIEWHVRLEDVQPTREGFLLTVTAVDPQTDVLLGDEFDIQINRVLSKRLEQRPRPPELGDRLVLKGVLRPRIAINPQREESGPFNRPRLIGPFAEFLFVIDVKSLTPAEEVKEPGTRRGAPRDKDKPARARPPGSP